MAFTFGSSGGFGGQQQQQNQQQQQPAFGGFGAAGSTGATPAFGASTGGFGQQPQQQQTSLFGSTGGFGSNASSTPAFGATHTGSTGGGLFGSQPASTGTGAFGGGSGFSFGQSSQPAQTGGGLFGSAGAGSGGFGTGLGGGMGGNPNDPVNPNMACPVPTNGSADAPPHPKDSQRILMWKDNRSGTQTGPDGKQTSITGEQLLFDNIVALPMYWHVSPEELRVQDYQQNRKAAPAQPAAGATFGGFGQSAGATTGGFGASAAPATGGFGQPAASGGLFGSNSGGTAGGGLFGSGGGFGKPATTTTGFGQPAASGGLFGQQSTTTTGGFGQPAAATSTFGGFGQNNATQQAKPAFSFGSGNTSQPASGGLFGSGSTTTGGFGQQNTQQAPTSTFGGFGQNNATANAGGGLFGAKPAGGGLFGGGAATDNKPTFSFGASNTSATTQPSGGLFGQSNQQQPAASGGGLFGNLGGAGSTTGGFGQQQQQQPAQNNSGTSTFGGGLFGGGAAQAKPAGGLFGGGGATTTSAPSFSFGGGANTSNNTNASGGLFGGGNSGGGLFGNNNAGQQQQQQQQPQQGGGLFGKLGGGSTGNTGGGGLFGNLGQTQNNSGAAAGGGFGFSQPGSSFGGFGQQQNNNQFSLSQPQNQQQQQQNLQPLNTSIDQNPYGNNPIFANVQAHQLSSSAPQAVNIDSPKRQPALTISYRGTPRSTPRIAKLRGFTTSASSPALNGSRFGSPALGGSGVGLPGTPLGASSIARSGTASPALALLNGGGLSVNNGYTLPPEAFVARPSVKKLVIDQKHRESSEFLFRKRNDNNGTVSGSATPAPQQQQIQGPADAGRIAFNPHAETAERGNGVPPSATAANGNKGKAPSMSATPSSQGLSAGQKKGGAAPTKGSEKAPSDGDYYTKPLLETLKKTSREDLAEVHDLRVGRVGFGEVSWLKPVDLTGLQSLDELLGSIVIIEDREVMVYPGEYEEDKPEVGNGLNVTAAVSLNNCWPLDKATRNPIKDPNNARVQQHIKKLRKKQETEFVDYEIETGTWTFKVQHFSRYGLDESDDEDEGAGDETMQRHDDPASSPAAQRKKALQKRASQPNVKRSRATDSPVSDSASDPDDADYNDDEDAPPQATLEDESMTEMDDSVTERSGSLSGTPGATRSRYREGTPGSPDFDDDTTYSEEGSEEETRRRKRSVVVPTPRFAPSSRLRDLESPVRSRYEHQPKQHARSDIRQPTPSVAGSESAPQRPIGQRLGLEPKKLAVMQASFFSSSKTAVDTVQSAAPGTPPARREILSRASGPDKRELGAAHSPRPEKYLAVTPALDTPETYIPTYRPLRKWKAVPHAQTLACGKEGQPADAGLMLGRSFRVSWGANGQLVTLGRVTAIDTKVESTDLTSVKIARPDLLVVAKNDHVKAATQLLELQLEHSDISSEADPSVLPLASTLNTLRFHHFLSKVRSAGPSEHANLWRLGCALFDEIDLRLPDTFSSETQQRVSLIRRRDAFSAWLKTAVAPAVEDELRELASSGSASAPVPATIFALLSGHQVERACQSAISNGDVRLATLLAQTGGDDEFRAHVDLQIQKWREYRVDPHIAKDYRKIYELLSGNVGTSKGIQGSSSTDSSEDITISEGLDWKRAMALRFWYARSDTTISNAVTAYDQDVGEDARLSKPLPEHALVSEGKEWQLPQSSATQDALYELIQLYTDRSRSLEAALSPRCFSASPVDFLQPWHLYELLVRAMRVRDFEDADPTTGYSAKAELLAESYADQLERAGLWTWSAFVYLHLEGSESREKAICELLARHVDELSHEATSFLKEKLHIPASYITDAREMHRRATVRPSMAETDVEADFFGMK